MQYFTIISTLFAAAVIAAPTANVEIAARNPAVAQVQAVAQTAVDAKVAAGCNVLKCLVALAPASATCAAALVEEGLNPIADIACFASASDILVNPPSGCNGC